ncbi:sensor histidine kinase [Streptomyces griseiscabiei]|uniref:hypothetical protein n=1 Tax=Streptomyces griseiscabiei TaxID=2993540 RepID=UPI000A3D1AB0|nr:hypothetical protein [Streptomyces griseiscabiei]
MAAAGLAATAVTLDLASGGSLAPGEEEASGALFLVLLGFFAAFLTLFLAVPMTGVWGLGVYVRRRRERVTRREDSALSAAVWAAVVEAYEERQRIAAELRQAVLRHADAVVVHAERDDLDGAAEQARAALTAMRELLAVLRQGAVTASGPALPAGGRAVPPAEHENEEVPPSSPEARRLSPPSG